MSKQELLPDHTATKPDSEASVPAFTPGEAFDQPHWQDTGSVSVQSSEGREQEKWDSYANGDEARILTSSSRFANKSAIVEMDLNERDLGKFTGVQPDLILWGPKTRTFVEAQIERRQQPGMDWTNAQKVDRTAPKSPEK